ncbi:MAG: DUF1775 domain-containing protein [Acidimicrobiia bacterium]
MIRKSMVAVAIVAVGVFVLAGIAGAHVEIAPDGKVAADGTIKATLSVPNECEGSETQSLDLNFPATPALTQVTVAPVAGFTFANTTDPATSGVTKLTITGAVKGSDEKKFSLTLGAIPAGVDTLKFTALQDCADGTVIRWVEPTPPGGQEPEHPAPVLEISSKSSGGETSSTTAAAKKSSSDDSSSTGIIIGVIAAVVVIGAGAFALTRRKQS